MPAKQEWARTGKFAPFQVLGTDLSVKDVGDLGTKLKDKWAAAPEKTIDQVEAEFRAEYDELKKTHPKATLAILRDGEKGWDPANPDKFIFPAGASLAAWKMSCLRRPASSAATPAPATGHREAKACWLSTSCRWSRSARPRRRRLPG